MVFISLNHQLQNAYNKLILSLENKYVTASQEDIFLKKKKCVLLILWETYSIW